MNFKEIFENNKTIAVYGMSTDISKPSHTVPGYMLKQGYNVIPINLNAELILKQKVYKSLADISDKIDILNVFRPSEQVYPIVVEAVERHKKTGDINVIWLQLGIVSHESKKLAEENGIVFVQNKCIYVEHVNYKNAH